MLKLRRGNRMAQKIRSLFTDEVVEDSVYHAKRADGSIDYIKMSYSLSNNPHGTIV